MLFAGKYKVELYDDKTESFIAKDGIGMHVEIKDPEKKPILSKYYTNEGQFVFTTHSPGEHYICLSPNSTRWFTGGNRLVSKHLLYTLSTILHGKSYHPFHFGADVYILFSQRVHLNIDVGEHANDYKQIQAKEKLSELQLRVRQLIEQVEQITKEQNYQRVSGYGNPKWDKYRVNLELWRGRVSFYAMGAK